MARICDICTKGRLTGSKVSHAKNRLRRIFLPNLHKLKVLLGGREMTVRLCTRCIKRLRKDKVFAGLSLPVTSIAKRPAMALDKMEKKPIRKVKPEEKKDKIPEKAANEEEKINIDSLVGKKG